MGVILIRGGVGAAVLLLGIAAADPSASSRLSASRCRSAHHGSALLTLTKRCAPVVGNDAVCSLARLFRFLVTATDCSRGVGGEVGAGQEEKGISEKQLLDRTAQSVGWGTNACFPHRASGPHILKRGGKDQVRYSQPPGFGGHSSEEVPFPFIPLGSPLGRSESF